MPVRSLTVLVVALVLLSVVSVAARPPLAPLDQTPEPPITLRRLSSFAPASRGFNLGAAEIVAHDPERQRLFVVNGQTSAIDIVSVSQPVTPTLVSSISIVPTYGSGLQSVTVRNGLVAVAVAGATKTDPGTVAFFDTDGAPRGQVTVGALPDMLTFTPDGTRLLTANEGEPNSYGQSNSVDPEGSVSIVDLRNGPAAATATTVGFGEFNSGGARASELPAGVRIFGPNATVAQDLEPEYLAISSDSAKAYVTLQENNALAVIDLASARVEAIRALGFKDHRVAGNELDSSDRDGPSNTAAINIGARPVLGMYQPDAIAAYQSGGQTYLVTVNEGDARDYPGLAEEARVSSLTLDATAFPGGAPAALARLQVTNRLGDSDNDGDYDALYSFGARSFSIWNASTGALVFDSGAAIERLIAERLPSFFNASSDDNSLDSRSDNKGPEPEGVTVGTVNGRSFAFIGLERIGGVLVYDVTTPTTPVFVQYLNERDFSQNLGTEAWRQAGDLAPEGLLFIPAAQSPTRTALLVVANEVSGTTTLYEIVADNLVYLPLVPKQ